MKKVKDRIIRALIAFIIFIIDIILAKTLNLEWYIELPICIIAYLISGYDILYKAIRNIKNGEIFDENFLMILATIGAFATLQFEEAVMVMVLYQVGEAFQDYAVDKTRGSVSSLMNLRPDYANLVNGDEIITVDPEEVKVGQTILVKPGEKVPLDGIVCDGATSLDTASLTGETKLRMIGIGDDVLSGSLNQEGIIKITVTKEYGESTVAKILELVENASDKKAKTENFITKFAKYYTPIVVICALLLAILPPSIIMAINGSNVFNDYIQRACSFLVISCPCALVISVPLSFFGGIGGASKLGILVKGSSYIEEISKIKRIAFDKTGTLTKGNFIVNKVVGINDTKDNIIYYAAYAEYFSNHPLAISIKKYYDKEIDKNKITNIKEIAGMGVELNMNGNTYLVGNSKLLKGNNISFNEVEEIGTLIYVSTIDKYLGYIVISDEIKPEAKDLINSLTKLNITDTIMLTGDNVDIARKVANEIGIKNVHANLLPQDKVLAIEEELAKNGGVLAYCGDGINDAPVLMRAAIKLSKKIMQIVYQNIIFAIAVKIIVLILGAIGIAGMWLAIFADVGVACICIINAMRTLYNKEKY